MAIFKKDYFIKSYATKEKLYDTYVTVCATCKNIHEARQEFLDYLKEENLKGEYKILDIKVIK